MQRDTTLHGAPGDVDAGIEDLSRAATSPAIRSQGRRLRETPRGYAQGRLSQYVGRSRRDGSNRTYA